MNERNIITILDIKNMTSISKNMDDKTSLEPWISISERMHVYDILGDALTTEIKKQVQSVDTGGTMTESYQTLLNNYVKPLACFATWLEASPFLYAKTMNMGIVKQSSTNSENISKDEFTEIYRQNIKDKVAFFRNELKDFLEKNKTTYPLYRTDSPAVSTSFSSGIYLGKYA